MPKYQATNTKSVEKSKYWKNTEKILKILKCKYLKIQIPNNQYKIQKIIVNTEKYWENIKNTKV